MLRASPPPPPPVGGGVLRETAASARPPWCLSGTAVSAPNQMKAHLTCMNSPRACVRACVCGRAGGRAQLPIVHVLLPTLFRLASAHAAGADKQALATKVMLAALGDMHISNMRRACACVCVCAGGG